MAATLEKIGTNEGRVHATALPFEYSYDPDHFDKVEALNRYSRLRSEHPSSIVRIEDRGCGHFNVVVYSSQNEKQQFYQNVLARIMENLLSALK